MPTQAWPSRDNRQRRPSTALIWLLAVGAGAGVANIYYIQPLLPLVRDSLALTSEQAGLVSAVAQAGYAGGLLLLAPLGDLVDRRRVILAKSALLVFALLAVAAAPNFAALLSACLAVGILGSLGQDFVPVAAHLATEETRGRIIGAVTTGILSGILLSRTLAGTLGDLFGWRAVYGCAAAVTAAVGVSLWRGLPSMPAAAAGSYAVLLRSVVMLACRHAILRKAMATQALLASTLGAFWSTLALMLAEPPFELGAGPAGAFGLAGAAGALAAPLFGRLADHQGPRLAIRLGCLLVGVSFVMMLILRGSLPILIAGAVLFDLGVMAGLVSHQSIAATIDPAARSRLNGLLMATAMAGVATGAIAGAWAWNRFGWAGVCLSGALAGFMALLGSFLPPDDFSTSRELT